MATRLWHSDGIRTAFGPRTGELQLRRTAQLPDDFGAAVGRGRESRVGDLDVTGLTGALIRKVDAARESPRLNPGGVDPERQTRSVDGRRDLHFPLAIRQWCRELRHGWVIMSPDSRSGSAKRNSDALPLLEDRAHVLEKDK